MRGVGLLVPFLFLGQVAMHPIAPGLIEELLRFNHISG
jgi:hypothetical protein